jgi:hypothetical protein
MSRSEVDPVPDILTTHALIDDVLDTFRDVLGPHAVRYRNHVYRGVNYQRKLLQLTTIPEEIALAWALHDIGIWTSGWDYIQPSLNQVDELAPRYRVAHVDRARQMVEWHHKVRPCRDDWWVETFQVADRIDVTRGGLRGALTRSDIRQVVNTFPYNGFHVLLVRTAAGWATKHPQRPFPMLRW